MVRLCKSLLSILFLLNIYTTSAQNTISQPLVLKDGWKSKPLSSTSAKRSILLKMIEEAREAEPPDLRGIVVVKDDQLVLDEYFNSFFWENIHDIRSAGKSLTAILAMIAVDKGLLSLDTKILDLFPEYAYHKNPSSLKNEITLEHALTMSFGLDADADNPNSPGNESNWFGSMDYVALILDLPIVFKPGQRYVYSSACAMLVGAAVEKVSGKTLEAFAQEHLFEPMEFGDYFWQKTPFGRTTAMGNFYVRTRDMAKIGYLLVSDGQWKGQSILSPESIKKITQHHQDITNYYAARGYGYMWYLNEMTIEDKQVPYQFASGNGGNKIFVVPSLGLVVAIGQTAYGQGYGHRRADKIFKMVLEAFH